MNGKVLLIISIIPLFLLCTSKNPAAEIKSSSIAGRWHTTNKNELTQQIDKLLQNAPVKKSCDNPLMLIVPHAGYQYSGEVAASGYRTLGTSSGSSINPDIIIIIGPSHYEQFHGCAVLFSDYIETPLGKVKLNRKIAGELANDPLFAENRTAFEREHSVEIQLPFIRRIFGDRMTDKISMVPLLAGELNNDDVKQAASKLASVLRGTRPLIIVSSDFTHYGPNFGYIPFKYTGSSTADKISGLDSGAIDYILKNDLPGFTRYTDKSGITICGKNPIRITLALPVDNPVINKIMYDTSGNVTGDYKNSVSYASILFCGSLQSGDKTVTGTGVTILTDAEKEFLLKAARVNIVSYLKKGKGIQVPDNVPLNCRLKRGAFVTLKLHGDLRGCIGYIGSDSPLINTVLDNSYNAAFRDSRFSPLQISELKDLEIEISVLTEPVSVKSVDEIKTGRDGLIIQNGMFRGLLLPQVAVEQGWDRDTFLSMTCVKAGLPEDAWKESSTKIFRFQAAIFGGEKP